VDELKQDCLCYLHYLGKPVKASRLFAGQEHEDGVKKIADHFNQNTGKYKSVAYDAELTASLQKNGQQSFLERDLSMFSSDVEAYHQLMLDIIRQQVASTQLVLHGSAVKRLFVDGGFSKNSIYMNLLAAAFPHMEVFAASMAQATALGAALAIHKAWNKKRLPNSLIKLQYFALTHDIVA
jgi:ribulose kinase